MARVTRDVILTAVPTRRKRLSGAPISIIMRPSRRPTSSIHQPVLTHEVCALLDLAPGHCVVDATVGAGGHSHAILQKIQPQGMLIGLDRDPMMLQFAQQRLAESPGKIVLRQTSYLHLATVLSELAVASVDRVLADLGLSSDQLSDASRGFSFDADGPLDLRFDVSSGEPAFEMLARASAAELAHIFQDYGEEPHSDRIAERILEQQHRSPIRTARQLAEAVESAAPRRRESTKHPATRIFQALRIAVNEELRHVAEFVNEVLPHALAPGGRAAVITFHSLEDRLVKQAFRETSVWRSVTKKPVTASSVEKRQNPRSRSAKLRVAERI